MHAVGSQSPAHAANPQPSRRPVRQGVAGLSHWGQALAGSAWALGLGLAAPLVAAYLILAPPAGDLAAATYRSDLFARVGFSTWDTGWYAAHGYWLPSYSLLSPALGAWLGVRVLLALCALAACALFGAIAERVLAPASARVAALVFALGFCVGLLSGRVPFDLGFALALGAVLALLRGSFLPALGLAVLASAASPVAGVFLGLAGLAGAVGHARRTGTAASGESIGISGHPGAAGAARTPAKGPGGTGGAFGVGGTSGATRAWLALAAAAIAPVLVLGLAYPNGGYEPFAASAFWPALAGVLPIALLLPRGGLDERGRTVVRVGAGLYALGLIAAYALHTPMGGNAARLGALLAAPLLAGVLWERVAFGAPDVVRASPRRGRTWLGRMSPGRPSRSHTSYSRDSHGHDSHDRAWYGHLWHSRPWHGRALPIVLAPMLLYWQLATPIKDYAAIAGDSSVHASYYAPLRSELARLTGGRATIVEVPLTKAHWESVYLPWHDGVRLARGWERQLDTRYAAIFYRPRLTAADYRAWLAANRVRYVALPDAQLDGAGAAEGALVAAGQPYLRELWRSEHWRLYRFMG